MQKWEYLLVKAQPRRHGKFTWKPDPTGRPLEDSTFVELLNLFGRQGWILHGEKPTQIAGYLLIGELPPGAEGPGG